MQYKEKGTENERTEKIDIVFEQDRNRSAAYINGDQIGECEFSVSENVWMITHTGADVVLMM